MPVGWLLIACLCGLLTVLGFGWGGLIWLRGRIHEEFASDDFSARVKRLINEVLDSRVDHDMRDMARRQAKLEIGLARLERRLERIIGTLSAMHPAAWAAPDDPEESDAGGEGEGGQ